MFGGVKKKISLSKDYPEVEEDRNESTNTTQLKSSIDLPMLKMSSEFSFGWIDGSGTNPGGGFGKPGGGRETRVAEVLEILIEACRLVRAEFLSRSGEGTFIPFGCFLAGDVELDIASKVICEKCGEGVKKIVFEGDDYKVKVVEWIV
ncbi:hypothetical protein Tco_0656270 [Tanacetum coccineum]|uniref:Uncharacterized protein n=1 Tax=Tanacetum coccineum TaxID=301880 RepID=A0ABQ4X9K0_9ASTR